jgi:hypothetical protein
MTRELYLRATGHPRVLGVGLAAAFARFANAPAVIASGKSARSSPVASRSVDTIDGSRTCTDFEPNSRTCAIQAMSFHGFPAICR